MTIESVLMRKKNRATICLSTQVGCAVDCSFCATAKMGFVKNLSVGEIIDQYFQLENYLILKSLMLFLWVWGNLSLITKIP